MAVTRIEGGGRTPMLGLIDAHTHMVMAEIPLSAVFTSDPNYLALQAGRAATATLMRGFTSVRDVAGPTFGLKRAIDEGVVVGPRIWPSGAAISQTSGHGDFRSPHHDLPGGSNRSLHFTERQGSAAIADGRPQVLQAVREQLTKGASHPAGSPRRRPLHRACATGGRGHGEGIGAGGGVVEHAALPRRRGCSPVP